jgi:hypothetical protein
VHPQSIDASAYVQHFNRPIDPSGKGFFKPLETLFGTRATTNEYAQLASVVAYLVEKDQPLLRDLAKGLAEGQTASEVLARRGLTWQAFQDAWLAWGRERFAREPARGQPVFDCPPELR